MAEEKTTSRKRRSYSEEEKQAVVATAKRLGVCGAAREHKLWTGTVSRWVKKYGVGEGERANEEQRSSTEPTVAMEKRESAATPESRSRETEAMGEERAAPSAGAAGQDGAAGTTATSPERRSQRTARRYTPSQKAEAVEYAAAHGVSAAAKKLGISRYSIYEWRRGVQKAGRGEGPSPTSGPAPSEVEAQRDREILGEWKKHPGLGPSQLRNQLRRRGIKVAVNTVRRVMQANGYRPPKVNREPHDKRYEATRPNHLWHLDFVQRYINRQTTFTLILLDDYSRFVVGHGVTDAERAELVIATFEQAVQRYGRPEMVIHDKGSAFWSWRGISRFTALLTELGIDQIAAEHKEWNGKVEVFNANLHKELFDAYRFCDVGEMQRRLGNHLHWYNHQRTHHALGGLLVPADRYYGRTQEVLTRIEAGAGRDGLDSLALDQRCLELFRVVSEGGVPTVWLMGHKLLSLPPSRTH